MLIYIARRLVWTIVVILAVLFITFLVFFKLPNGDPALRFAGRQPQPAELVADRRGCDALARVRRRDRGALGRQAADVVRPLRDGLCALRHLGPCLLVRPDGPLHLLA